MILRWSPWLVAGVLFGAPDMTRANPHRLDDTGTYTVPPHVQMQWRERRSGMSGAAAMDAVLRVQVRLDTRRWIGQRGRVYLTLPRNDTQALEARWTTQGRLLPGALRPGERALVWSGTVSTATLEDQLLMQLSAGTDWHTSTRRLDFHFEFDVD